MDVLMNIFYEEWAMRAILTSVLVGITCGILGCFIVLRNMSLIGDALSHAILPGIYVSYILVGYSTLGFFVGSVLAGMLTAVAITWIQQRIKTKNDAAIGIVFTAMFAIGVIGISRLNNTQGNHLDLKDFLFGNVLGISNEDIYLTTAIAIFTTASVIIMYRYLFLTTFQEVIAQTMGISVKWVHYFLMVLLSFAVVGALRSVGVILVVALLITPAATALLLTYNLKRAIVYAAALGALASVSGIIVAIYLDITPGPTIVLMAVVFYALAGLFSPIKGLIPKYWRLTQASYKVIEEDIIKLISKGDGLSLNEMGQKLDISGHAVRSALKRLSRQGLVEDGREPKLTIKGVQMANDLVRAHRLWESYQVDKMGLETNQIHDDAERIEHSLTPDIVDEIDRNLGFPDQDPHGSPIPKRANLGTNYLLSHKPKSKIFIAKDQDKHVESELWERSIMGGAEVQIVAINAENVVLQIGNKREIIPAEIAQFIKIGNK